MIKASPEDFVVIEDLGYPYDGEGEQLLVRIRKIGCNTRFVAEAIAKFLGVHQRDLSYAGMKDRHAVTEQTLCFRVPGTAMPNLAGFQLEGVEILQVIRHKRKLRTGALAGNAFRLVVRQVSDRAQVESRLQRIQQQGVPNYFGEQRFGRGGNNRRAPVGRGEIPSTRPQYERHSAVGGAQSAVQSADQRASA